MNGGLGLASVERCLVMGQNKSIGAANFVFDLKRHFKEKDFRITRQGGRRYKGKAGKDRN